ncbi:hypothetical protein KSF_007890 [Reticulibacter mediterranei]|uniref:HPr-rel-A system PqqD family protein n=1 Tax=Reticulibacter mediterranei TaxID=2778369 RepID=A0A8J3IJF0_9CHLR|nr:PqqD family peptide modification chaperone [Reticulibacter mediterranei]GHO90741.1 hypothetical protein KSF_007890 [Reticulibacter mediterranei]
MSLFQLVEHAVFDTTDGDGVLLDGLSGYYFHLNPVATRMLEAALCYPTLDEVVARLHDAIEADDATLRDGVSLLQAQLRVHHLLVNEKGTAIS